MVVVSYPALQEAFNESDAIRLIALFANIALLSPLFGPWSVALYFHTCHGARFLLLSR